MAVISMKQLLESGVHFGHQTRRWNPKMGKYIYTSRNGIHILDLQKTVVLIEEAYNKFLEIGKNGGKVLFVGTKKQAQDVVKDESIRGEQFYVSQRWLGGTLTNFKTIRKSIRRLHDIYRMEKDGTFEQLPKKEVVLLRKELARLEKFLGGIKDMRALPEAIFIVDPRKERNAILEARKLKIPVYGIVDTNCDPDDVDYIIPANDDAIRSVKLIVGKFVDALIIGGGGEVIPAPRVEYVKRDNRTPYKVNRPPYKGNNTNKPYVKKPYVKSTNGAPSAGKPAYVKKPYVAPTKPVGTTPVAAAKPVVNTPAPTKVVEAKKVETKVVKPVVKEVVKPVVKEVAKPAAVDFTKKTVAELREVAKAKGLTGYSKLKKADLIEALK